MAKARISLFPAALRRQTRSESLKAREEIAHKIAADAADTAHVLTGRYQASFDVEVHGTQVQVISHDMTAIHKEYGTSKMPAQATLTNAAMAYGKYSGTRPRKR
ncbi:hypothetical protein [Corynebacterium renale]|uniref:hypothetical protein n=1 Tax=Corynebacterium renale TaxID=1724 RepID=UPI0006538940|nr:hypothetical protein [Corynebacterium renale]